MTNIIKIKRGLKSNLNNSGTNEGELKYTTDSNELYIYNNGENKLLTPSLLFYENQDAFIYNPSTSANLTINGDWSTLNKRKLYIQGDMCTLMFHCTGNTTEGGNNWTNIGTIPEGKRPMEITTVIGMIFNNGINESAGGDINNNTGIIRLWTNTKKAGNNYQVRIVANYRLKK